MRQYISISILFLLTLSHSCNIQKNSSGARNRTINKIYSLTNVEKIVSKIEKGKTVESFNIGDGGQVSFQYLLYNQLIKNASLSELANLLDHPSPAVRCYSFKGLVSNKSDSIIPYFLKHINDTTKVETLNGCIGSSLPVRDYYWTLLSLNFNEYNFSMEQRQLINNVISLQ